MAPAGLPELPSVDAALAWLRLRGVRGLSTDSRRVRAGDAFIAWPGYAQDGRAYVADALAAGAAACLVEADGADAFELGRLEPDAAERSVAALRDLKPRTGLIASGFYGAPSERLKVIAVTGTNGKTSTSWWVAQALGALGRRCGVIGTLGVGEPPLAGRAEAIEFTGLTTPDPITLQAGFRRFADAGFAACAIEATSIGLEEHRLAGAHIDIALLTNVTQDHLDYHKTMQAYWEAKARLFAWTGLQAAVLNLDDERGVELARSLAPARSGIADDNAGVLDLWTYSTQRADARLRALDIRYVDGGLAFDALEGAQRAPVRTALIGDYNVANLLAMLGALRALDVPLADAAAACAALTPVPGRMQRMVAPAGAPQPEVVVDYSHTPDALDKALRALQPLAAQRGGALWCVFGCGGNRDAGKRPVMGRIAQSLAQRVVVTSDNPRLESPAAIIAQVLAGFDNAGPSALSIENRADAIAQAVAAAAPADVILLAGKGHEDYQDIGGRKLPFSDIEQAERALARRGGIA